LYSINAFADGTVEVIDRGSGEDATWMSPVVLDASGNERLVLTDHEGRLRYVARLGGSIETVRYRGYLTYKAPSLALDGSGNPHITFCSHADTYSEHDTLFYALKSGDSWAFEIVDEAASVTLSSIVVDGAGNPHICYVDEGEMKLKYAVKSAGSWTLETVASVFYSNRPTLSLDQSGNPHIGYEDALDSSFLWDRAVRYAVRSGGAWVVETVDMLVDPYPFPGRLQVLLALDTSGNPHICYTSRDAFGAPQELQYAVKSTGTWAIETVESPSMGIEYLRPSLALDGSGNPHIVYSHLQLIPDPYVPDEAWLQYAVKSGGSWVTESVDSANYFASGSIVVDGSGNVHIIYVRGSELEGDYDRMEIMRLVKSGGSWLMESVPGLGDAGKYVSLALDTLGNPCLSYRDGVVCGSDERGDLKYAAKSGESWVTQVVDSGRRESLGGGINYIDNGRNASLAFDASGNPHISYCRDEKFVRDDDTSKRSSLMYAVRSGDSWVVETVADDANNYYDYGVASLGVDGTGAPHISYVRASRYSTEVWHAVKSDGVWTKEWVALCEGGYSEANATSMALDGSGNPHISYYDYHLKALGYVKKSGGHWSGETVDSDGDAGTYSSLVLDSQGNPHIAYRCTDEFDPSVERLKYAVKQGGSWVIETVGSNILVSKEISLALDISGNPHISYLWGRNLEYVVKSGGAWAKVRVHSNYYKAGGYNSLAVKESGKALIGYYDPIDRDLKLFSEQIVHFIGWAGMQGPAILSIAEGAISPPIYGQVHIEDLTAPPGQTAGLVAQVGCGPHGTDPQAAGWYWSIATFSGDVGGNDEFVGTIKAISAGQYDYCYRYSLNGGSWSYGDLDGSQNGYSPTQAGALTVVGISWANLQTPPSLSIDIGCISEPIYGRVMIEGFTNQSGATAGLEAELGFGPDDSDPSANPLAWQWHAAAFNTDAENKDEFMTTLWVLTQGQYDYCYRYRLNGGPWVYADLDGSENGYSLPQAGALTVVPTKPLTILDGQIKEGNSGTREVTFRCSLPFLHAYNASVQYQTSDGTATVAGNDYVASYGTIMFPPTTLEYVADLATRGTGDEQVSAPNGVAVGPNGEVYVVDTGNNRIQKFRRDGSFERRWGSYGSLSGQFNMPVNIATSSVGYVFVVDQLNYRIQQFQSNGAHVRTWGSYGAGNGRFQMPTGIAADDIAQEVYVADQMQCRVQVFDFNGQFKRAWGQPGSGDGQFTIPQGVAVDAAQNVYVVDSYNGRVQKFDRNGTFLSKWGSKGSAAGQFNGPRGIAIDGMGYVHVSELGNQRVQVFEAATGAYVMQWTAHGTGYRAPEGIAMDPSGLAYATYPAYSTDDRVEKYRFAEMKDTIAVAVYGDTTEEPDEYFTLNLSNPAGMLLNQTSATGTIMNDDTLVTLSVLDTFVTEGNGGASPVSALVRLSHGTSHDVTFNYHTENGTATVANNDYLAASGAVTIPAGQSAALIPLEIIGDSGPEPDETFAVVLTDVGGADVVRGTATVVILDDEAPRALSIGDGLVTEGNSGTKDVTLTVTLSAPRQVPVSVSWATRDSTTNNYLDYVPASGQLTINPGYTSGTITVSVVGDEYKELNEVLIVRLSDPVNATIADRDGLAMILDDGDSQYAIWMLGGGVTEGNTGMTPVGAQLLISAPAVSGMSVNWTTIDGTATVADNDYIAASGTYDIPVGAAIGTISGPQVVGDTLVEPDECFRVSLTGATGAVIAQPLGNVNIRNDDAELPDVFWTYNTVDVSEGEAVALRVELSHRTPHEVHVYYNTANGAAKAGSDYVAATGTLVIPPNSMDGNIVVSTSEDTLWEPSESFRVVLTGASYAFVTDTTIVVNITDDDPLPAFNHGDVTVTEGNSGRTPVNLILNISQAMDSVVTVDFETKPGTAYSSDFVDTSGTVTFAVGHTAETLTVYVKGDTATEANEVFYVEYSHPHLARFPSFDDRSEITIRDDDIPRITMSDVSIAEGNSGTVTASVQVSLSDRTRGEAVRVQYLTRDGTATAAGGDYVAKSGTLQFPLQSTAQTISVSIDPDTRREPDETFELVLRNPENATLADSIGVITVMNDDPMPTLQLADVTVWEGNTGTRTASIQASLSQSTDYTVTANWHTHDGTATVADGDYVSGSGVLSFAPGETLATVNVQVNGDTRVEPTESFTVGLTGVSEAAPTDTTATVTIRDDDSLPLASILDASVTEGNTGLVNCTLPLSFTKPIDVPFRVTMSTTDGSATVADQDYVAVNAPVDIAPAAATFERKWGTSGTGNGQFSAPRGIAVDTAGVVYVVDTGNNRIQKFDKNGTYLTKWGSAGTGNGQFSAPEGIAVDDSSNVYIVDTGNNRIQKFDKNGAFMKKWSTYDTFYGFSGPRCAAIDNAGYLYVTDYGNTRVVKFDRNGGYIEKWDKDAYGISFEDSSYVYTTTPTTNYVNKYTLTFNVRGGWNGSGGVNLSGPRGIAVSKGGGVYVVDRSNSRIVEFNGSGTLVTTWGSAGVGDGQFNLPYGIAVAKNLDFYVADTGNNRIQKFHRPSTTTAACTVQVHGDYHYEPAENLTVTLSNPQRIYLDRDAAVVAINNDDTVPAVSIAGASTIEGNSGTTPVSLEVRLSARSGFDATVNWATSDSTAVSAADYLAASGTLTIPAGDSLGTIDVSVLGDIDREPSEVFKIVLSNPVTATLGTSVGLVSIIDDDRVAAMRVSDASMMEGNSGTRPLKFPVSVSWPIDAPASFSWQTVDGTAGVGDNDYAAGGGTVTLSPPAPSYLMKWGSQGSGNGAFQNPENIAIAGDGTVYVADRGNNRIQRFSRAGVFQLAWSSNGCTGVALDDSTNVYVAEGSRITKFDRDGVYKARWSVTSGAYGVAVDASGNVFVGTGGYYVREFTRAGTLIRSWGGSGTGNGQFNEARGVAVDDSGYVYVFDGGTHSRVQKFTGQGVYVTKWGSSGSGDGQFCAPYAIAATAQAIYVADKCNNRVQKFSHSGAFLGKWGTSGTGNGQFTQPCGVALNDSLDVYVSDTYNHRIQKFGHGTPVDTIAVAVNGDTKYETDEAFTLALSNPAGANLWRSTIIGTILNDDAAPIVSVGDIAVEEGNGPEGGGTGITNAFTPLTLSCASPLPVTVSFHTADSTATVAGNDYIPADSSVTIPPGETSGLIALRIRADWAIEPNEIFKLVLGGATGATLGDGVGLVTITNDDSPPLLSISDASVAEGDTGTMNVALDVTMSHPLDSMVAVRYRTVDGTATGADLDFVATTGVLEIPAGNKNGAINVLVRGDRRLEPDEDFTVVLSTPQRGTIEDSVGVVTIVNDDGVPALHVADAMIVEGDAGTRTVLVPVSLSLAAGLPVKVHWHTVNGTATVDDADYVAASDSLTFAPGDTLKYAAVSVRGDTRPELNETFRVVLTSASGALIADTMATGTIVNDDLPVMSISDASAPEGDGGTTSMFVVVSLSGPVSHDIAVEYQTRDSTATLADGDYAAASGVLAFSPGVVADTVMVSVNGDETFEADEVLWIVLENPSGCLLADSVGSIAIVNDDDEPTGTDDTPAIREFALLPPWPNPSDGNAVHFEFTMPRQERVRIVVYDVAGREVARLVDGEYPMGRHQKMWDARRGGRSIASGVYFVRFNSGGKTVVRRMVLLR